MDIYTNSRAWRVQLLLWLFWLAAIGLVILGISGWQNHDVSSMETGLIAGPIVLLFAVGMEVYARRYITAMRVVDGDVWVETRGVTGRHLVSGSTSIGERKHDGDLGGEGARGSAGRLIEALAAVEFRGIDNQYHILEVGPRQRRFILDVTADPDAEQRIRQAMRAARDSKRRDKRRGKPR